MANLSSVQVAGQGAFQVAAWIAVHDKYNVVYFVGFHPGTHSGYVLVSYLVQSAAPRGLGPVPGHHVKVRCRIILGAVQVDVHATGYATCFKENCKLIGLGKLFSLKPEFIGPLLPGTVGDIDVGVIGEAHSLILRAIKPYGGSNPVRVKGSNTQFRSADICRVRVADCTNSLIT